MRVAWVYPPMEGGVPQLTQNRFFKWTQSYDVLIYPVIPASACTLLKSDGFDVRYIDAVAMRLPWDELASRLSSFAPDLVLMEAKTPVVRRVWRAANGLKSALPDARVALCGDHVSVLPRESLERCRAVDYVITGGDFDLGALKLAKALRDGDGLPAGLWYRGADGVATTGRFELAEDLDSLPFIDRELVPWQPYHESWRLHDEFFYIMSGRGCMYRCTFCMSGDAALVIREEGRIAVKTVSDLFAKVEERDPILFGEDELVEVGDKGLYVWSDGGFVRLRRVSRRPADGELYRVITHEGRNVLLSRRHRVPVRRDGREILLHAEEIRPGDHIKVMRRLPTPGRAVGWISLLEEFARLPTALLDDVYVRNVSGFLRRIGYARGGATVPRSTRYRRAREGIVPIVEFFRLLRAYGVGTEELAVARLGVRGSTMSVPLFYPVTGELLRLLGYFVAEGHYNGYSLVISTARQEVRRDVLRIVPKVFTGSFITEWVDTRKETGRVKGGRLVRAKLPGYQIYFGGKVARLLFERAFGIPGSARRKRVPDVVFNLPEELQGEFLRGLFTGDGSLRSDGTVGFSSRSRILRQGVSFLLTRLGVEHNLLEERDGSYGDLLYRIKITSWDGRQRFLEKIGFMDVRRQGDLREIQERGKPWRVRILEALKRPMGVGEVAAALSMSRSHAQTELYRMLRKGLVTRIKLPSGCSVYARVPDTAQSSSDYLEVRKVDRVVPESYYLYDVETESGLLYADGIQVHNCSWPAMLYGYRYRLRSVGNVLDEIEMLADRYGAREVFDDLDTWPSKGRWAREFCRGMIERGLSERVVWGINARADLIEPETARLMRRAGCRVLKIGVESASQETLDRIRKRTTLRQIRDSVRVCREAGLTVHLTAMIGYPWEGRADALRTIRFVKRLEPDSVQFSIVTPYPGTELYRQALANGWFAVDPTDWDSFDMSSPVLKAGDMEPEEVVELCERAWKLIYFDPRFVLRHLARVRSVSDLKLLLRGMKAVVRVHIGGLEAA